MMNCVLGIDTGGTYTDAVLYHLKTKEVVAKAKSPTTHENLAIGIGKALAGLKTNLKLEAIEKVVLSTTLATNAIVEGKGRPTGLILIGEPPKGELPDVAICRIQGKVNVKGKETIPLIEQEIITACELLKGKVEAIAVAGMMSVRNAVQELTVKQKVQEICGVPVVCSHELSSQLGFTDRTVTTILNAGLIPILKAFIICVKDTLSTLGIDAPIYMVKGDGNLASLALIEEKPIESILSGPAASVIGALTLADCHDGIVVDMGGTTSDSALVLRDTIALSPKGARVGSWQTQIDSAQINTWGLGGDTAIIIDDEGHPMLTGSRVLPACRGNIGVLTPTDILHIKGEYIAWDRHLSQQSLETMCKKAAASPDIIVQEAELGVLACIEQNVLADYDPHLPVIAIGAPAQAWYGKLASRTERRVIIPEHCDVANALGAAVASVEERTTGLVRPDEENDGYVTHVAGECHSFKDKEEAIAYATKQTEANCRKQALAQVEGNLTIQVFVQDVVEQIGWRERYVRTDITAVAKQTQMRIEK